MKTKTNLQHTGTKKARHKLEYHHDRLMAAREAHHGQNGLDLKTKRTE